MVKYLVSIAIVILLTSCKANTKPETNIIYVDKSVPTYYVPSPPAVQEPMLEVKKLTVEQRDNIGELAKAYNISLQQAMMYACQLKAIVDEYASLSAKTGTIIPFTLITKESIDPDFSNCKKL